MRNVSDVSGIVLTNAIINSSSTVEIKTDSAGLNNSKCNRIK